MADMVVFAVTGARTWGNRELVEKAMTRLAGKYGVGRLLCVHGGAPGLDVLAEDVCASMGIHTARVDARWGFYHRAAGPIRNEVMKSLGVRFVLAFHWDLDDSKGTADMVRRCKKAGLPVMLVKARSMRVGLGKEIKASLDAKEGKQLEKRRKRENLAKAATTTKSGARRKRVTGD